MGDINTESPVRMKTNTPVTLCSLEKQVGGEKGGGNVCSIKNGTEFEDV